MAFAAVSAGIGAAGLITGVVKSIGQSNEAKNIDKNNPRPNYSIPEEYKQNLALANHMAQIGLPQAQYNNQLNQINSRQAGAVNALSNSANPGANLAAVVRAGADATGNLNAQDAMARQNNQRYAIGQSAALGQQKLAQQQYDKFDRYSENFNRSQALKGAANANMNNAFNSAGQLASGLYGTNTMGNLGFGKAGQSDYQLSPGTAQRMQPPESIWGNFGTGSTNLGFNPYENDPSYQKYNYNPNE